MITYELCTYDPLGRVALSPLNYKPVIQLNEDPAAITVHADSPWKTLEEFVNDARQRPGELTIGNSGPGAVWHIGALKLEKLAGAQFTHVPHNGAKPAVTQLLGKHLDAVSVSPAEVLQYLELGSLRCLGVMSEGRLANLPDVPTCREQGFDLVHGTWRGLAVPPETPDEIVAVLGDGFKKGFDAPEFQETAHKALLGLRYRDANQFKEFLEREYKSVTELFTGSDLVVRSGSNVYMVPRFYAALFVLFGLALIVRAFRKKPSMDAGVEALTASSMKTIGLAFCILLGYAVLMFALGYIVSTILYLAVMFVILGERRPAAIVLYSVCIVFAVYVVFKSILDVPIPGFFS